MKTHQPTDSELYHFDTFGYLVIEDAIPQDRLQRLQRCMRAGMRSPVAQTPVQDPDFRVPSEGAGVRAKMMHPILKTPIVLGWKSAAAPLTRFLGPGYPLQVVMG